MPQQENISWVVMSSNASADNHFLHDIFVKVSFYSVFAVQFMRHINVRCIIYQLSDVNMWHMYPEFK